MTATAFAALPVSSRVAFMRQHLIDPEVCIRCNTCEESCPHGGIVHNDDNYAVLFDACTGCGKCLDPCPTGAIANWRDVSSTYSVDEQFSWSQLPAQQAGIAIDLKDAAHLVPPTIEPAEELPALAESELTDAFAVKPAAPSSASRPVVNAFKRNQPATATIVANVRLTAPESDTDVRHIVLRFADGMFPVLEGQSLGIVMPGADSQGKRHAVRQYSIASPRNGEAGEPNTVALTVKRVQGGLCSNHLCDLSAGASVDVTGPFGATFLMPNDPAANIVMVCTGTGVAPFRGFVERRRQLAPESSTGKLVLFYGAQTPQSMPYVDYLEELPVTTVQRDFSYSRLEDRPKIRVQQRIRASAALVSALLRDDLTHLYICGLKGMEQGVEQALAEVCGTAGLDWIRVRDRMRAAGRYHVETY
ncbi:benzoyl-CoA 2,3-epoxidase subunit BoxA [Variovorax sp. dw_308]|uniref:benzoyl-CoA 2,3-epoxidase subunit BoxA n=1 Tax=Variovorax sp. dw_308 TaxID=2721546 RepID=UPI002108E1D9|nr:benzoyl-CoA 2,3-epoxidase subunit BoxA [Variovorax sp. dw_308]